MKNVYPYLPAFCFSFLSPYEKFDRGKIYENTVLNCISTAYYYRECNNEIDFVLRHDGKAIPIDVKSGNYHIFEVARSMRRFRSDEGMPINQDSFNPIENKEVSIYRCAILAFCIYPEEFFWILFFLYQMIRITI